MEPEQRVSGWVLTAAHASTRQPPHDLGDSCSLAWKVFSSNAMSISPISPPGKCQFVLLMFKTLLTLSQKMMQGLGGMVCTHVVDL
jgi:hypothetical protein